MSDTLLPHGLWPTRLLHLWGFLGKNAGMGCHFLLQGLFPTRGLNLGLLHCGQMLYRLSNQRTKAWRYIIIIQSINKLTLPRQFILSKGRVYLGKNLKNKKALQSTYLEKKLICNFSWPNKMDQWRTVLPTKLSGGVTKSHGSMLNGLPRKRLRD